MADNKTNKEKDKETFEAYAGVAVMFAFIIILFVLTTPGVLGGDNQDDADIEPTEVAQVIEEATGVPVETEEAIATEEATDAPVETEEAIVTEEATDAPVETEEAIVTEEATDAPVETEEAIADVETASYDPEIVANGESLFVTCSACHGSDGTGITGLGKDLVGGDFVNSLSDDELVDFIIIGRPVWDAENTTFIDMPPKGGNPTLTNEDIFAIVAYLRTLSGDAAVTNADAGEESSETEEATGEAIVTEEAIADVETASYDPEIVANGESLFVTCSACHGSDGTGITGLGKDLVGGDFVNSLSDDELVDFIIIGRPVWDAENTTMIDMPPKGGNPTLTNEDIFAIVAYLRTLSGDATVTNADAGEESSETDTGESASDDEAATAYDAESIANGESLFVTCSACHGPDGTGITGLGKDLVGGEFALNASDDELVAIITSGRPVWDAENTTMIDMPPKGGNPTLTGDDINDILAYIRSLQLP